MASASDDPRESERWELAASGAEMIYNAAGKAWTYEDGNNSYRRSLKTGELVYYGGTVVTARKSAGGKAPRRKMFDGASSSSTSASSANADAAKKARLTRPLAAVLPALASASGEEEQCTWQGPWSFVQLADTQLGLYKQAPDGSAEQWEQEAANARRAVAFINGMAPRPKFAIVCGDLTNAMPNGPTAHPANCEAQRKDFEEIFTQVHPDVALVCVCGNHDVGDRPNAASIEGYRSWFGPDYGGFTVGGCRFLVLNSSLYAAQEGACWEVGWHPKDVKDDPKYAAALKAEQAEAHAHSDEQDEWLDEEVGRICGKACGCGSVGSSGDGSGGGGGGGGESSSSSSSSSLPSASSSSSSSSSSSASPAAAPQHVIGFMHIPPFIYSPDEPKGYFNFDPSIRGPLLAKLKAVGMTKLFCGHFHRNAGGHDGPLEVVVTSAVGCTLPWAQAAKGDSAEARKLGIGLEGFDWPARRCDGATSGLRVVAVGEKDVNHRFFTLDELDEISPGALTKAVEAGGSCADKDSKPAAAL